MEKNFKMMVKKVVEVACIAGITLAVNGAIDGINDTQIQPVANAQEVSKQLIVKDSIKFEKMVTDAIEGTELKVVETSKSDSGNYIVDLSNGAFVVYDVKNNIIEFQPVELGDWDVSFDNIDDARNCIATYAGLVAPTKGVVIKSEDWLDDSNNENKDLIGNVIIDDGKKIIEISKEVYDEIEYGENSVLEGGICLDNDDIISSSLYHQVGSVEELKDNFNKFGVVDSRDDGNRYVVTLDHGLEVIYLVDYDMFYVYNNDGNIKEFECMNDTKDYLSTTKGDSVNDGKDDVHTKEEITFESVSQESKANEEESQGGSIEEEM